MSVSSGQRVGEQQEIRPLLSPSIDDFLSESRVDGPTHRPVTSNTAGNPPQSSLTPPSGSPYINPTPRHSLLPLLLCSAHPPLPSPSAQLCSANPFSTYRLLLPPPPLLLSSVLCSLFPLYHFLSLFLHLSSLSPTFSSPLTPPLRLLFLRPLSSPLSSVLLLSSFFHHKGCLPPLLVISYHEAVLFPLPTFYTTATVSQRNIASENTVIN